MKNKKEVVNEIGTIFLYVASFGFSDYIVEYFQLKKYKYLIFYLIILLTGSLILIWNNRKGNDNKH